METKSSGKFLFEPPDTAPVGSVLYTEHLKLIDQSRLAPFAGFLMPLWYSSISEEHSAVRNAAGLFDCTHMGVLEVAGPQAAEFLNTITTNDINKLNPGSAQYSYILDPAGNVLDDIIVYARQEDKFMVVVNAANEPKIKAYLDALQSENKPPIRDMRDTNTTSDCKVDIALQGPASIDILSTLTKDSEIENLKPFKLIETTIDNIDCIISRTGYTGAKLGFELFVHPQQAPLLWSKLLQNGKPLGLLPCGLGARDSLRIEAGLPLYGHELAGEFNISPFEAGYSWAVKLEKPFFIGKAVMQQTAATYDMKVTRIELPGQKGIRPIRQNDGILNNSGQCIGWVLSSAKAGEKQFALAYIMKDTVKENDPVGLYYLARNQSQIDKGKKQSVQKQQTLQPDITGTIISRFEKF
ncbi:MAG: glycine cleavage system aminomethyltransferase GcvT [Planctomycetes bacterium]|nr:glycine cleavage system aminomethyltransferase GcvT [Planctomycetota bacterium]